METAALLQDLLFYITLKFLTKYSLNKEILFSPSLKGPRKVASFHIPQIGAPLETDAHLQSLTENILRGQ